MELFLLQLSRLVVTLGVEHYPGLAGQTFHGVLQQSTPVIVNKLFHPREGIGKCAVFRLLNLGPSGEGVFAGLCFFVFAMLVAFFAKNKLQGLLA
jgi:hypothetical protein